MPPPGATAIQRCHVTRGCLSQSVSFKCPFIATSQPPSSVTFIRSFRARPENRKPETPKTSWSFFVYIPSSGGRRLGRRCALEIHGYYASKPSQPVQSPLFPSRSPFMLSAFAFLGPAGPSISFSFRHGSGSHTANTPFVLSRVCSSRAESRIEWTPARVGAKQTPPEETPSL